MLSGYNNVSDRFCDTVTKVRRYGYVLFHYIYQHHRYYEISEQHHSELCFFVLGCSL